MNTKWLTNPFFVYILSFLLVFGVYNLEWSEDYPKLTLSLKLFLYSTFFLSFFLGLILEKAKKNSFSKIPISNRNYIVVSIIMIGYLLEFVYSRGIPLIETIRGSYNYKDFTGIPTFHVVLYSVNFFYSIYLFHQYQSNAKQKTVLLVFFISVIPHLLVLNRGALIMTIISCAFLYLMKTKRLKAIRIVQLFGSVLILFYFFGLIGNLRYSVSKEDKEFILRIGGASDRFIESSVPSEYYWMYLYVATPIGNVQNVISTTPGNFNAENLPYFASSQLLPDFISKRINVIFNLQDPVDQTKNLVIEALNASSMYYRPYQLLGITGMIVMYIYSACIMLFYPFLIKKESKYYLSGWVCLLTIVVLNVFNNMWSITGLLQLSCPLFLSFFEKNNSVGNGNVES